MKSPGSSSPYQGWVVKLIIVNVVVYVFQIFTASNQTQHSALTYFLGLTPSLVVEKGFIWQVVSYMFLHSTAGFFHIFFNMYAVLIFGTPIEQEWGSRKFLGYYFFCGAGAGISILVINLILQGDAYHIPTIGASGAVFGLLLAFGVLYPNSEILLFFFIPMRAKYLVMLFGLVELYLVLFSRGHGSISHIGHLGGLFFGIVYFLATRRNSIKFRTKMFAARMEKKAAEIVPKIGSTAAAQDERAKQKDILARLRNGGLSALSDDEVQYIKYLAIMKDGASARCDSADYNIDDAYCANCEDADACFIREVKRHKEN
ncbi:MAG TPA: rhomboid family intramembrane serine protease [Spirochaetota bacterium]|nr:rhomboid family intramembrane serine protease [Spirochaetota bacterium]